MRNNLSLGGRSGCANRFSNHSSRRAVLALATAMVSGLAVPKTHAATYVYDPLFSTTSSTDGAGVWNAGTANFYNVSGSTGPQNWSNLLTDTAQFGSGGTAGNVTVSTVNAGAILFSPVTGNYNLTGGTITLAGAGVLNASSGTSSIISSVIAGGPSVNLLGGGILTLSGANTFTGGLNLSGGTTLNINAAAGLGATAGGFNIGTGSVIDNTSGAPVTAANPVIQGGIVTFKGTNALTFSGGYTLFNAGNGTMDNINVAAGTMTISGAVSGTAGLIKSGPGTLSLTATGQYTGGLNVSGGFLQISTVSQLGAGSAANGGNVNTASGTVFIGPAEIDDNNTTTGVPISPGVNFVFNNSNSVFNLQAAAANISFQGSISGAGSLNKAGPGTIVINTNNVSYAGVTNIAGGTLSIGGGNSNGSLGVSTGVTIASGAQLAINMSTGINLTTPITGAGNVLLNSPLLSGATTLNPSNTYTGVTNISAGSTLSISNIPNGGIASSIGMSSNASGNLLMVGTSGTQNTFGAGATLLYTGAGGVTDRGITFGGTVQNTINVSNPSSTLTIAGQAQTLSTTGSFRFYKQGPGTLAFTNAGPNTFNFGVFMLVDAGTLQLGAPGQVNNIANGLIVGNQLATPGATPLYNQIDGTTNVNGSLAFSNGDPNIGQNLTANISGGTLNANGVQLIVNGTNNSILNLTNAGILNSSGIVAGPLSNGSTSVINISGTSQLNVTATGSILSYGGGTAGTATTVNQTGGAATFNTGLMLVNSGANLAAGTYNLGNGSPNSGLLNTAFLTAFSSNLSSNAVVNFNGGTLQANTNNSAFLAGINSANVLGGGTIIDTQGNNVGIVQPLVHGGTASIDGGVTKFGGGTLTLGNSSTYTGGTKVQAGTLAVGNSQALGTGTVSLANNTSLSLGLASQQAGFNGFTTTGNGVFTPVISSNGNALTLTTNVNSEATSAFTNSPVTVNDQTGFTASFTYAHSNVGGQGAGADGITFTFQNQSNTALGASGGALGYTTITPSVAAGVDDYHDELATGQNGVLAENAAGSVPGISAISSSYVTIVYNGFNQTLTETLSNSQGNYTTTLNNFDLATQLGEAGSNVSGFIGFTGGTGAINDTEVISNFTFSTPVGSGINLSNLVTVADSSSSTIVLSPTALFSSGSVGPITIGNGSTLAVSIGSNPFNNVTHGVLTAPSVTFSNSTSGTLDAAKNALDLTSQSLVAVTSLVATAFSNGAWNGPGITSTAAASDSTHLTALGVISNTTATGSPLYGTGAPLGLFDGITPGANDVLVKYTYYGDANLDGQVDGSDYSLIDNGFANHLTGWYNGDFNYDGIVDGSDYTLMDNAFNSQSASLASALASPTAQLATSLVPEPATLSLLVISGLGLLGRRRK